MKKILLLGLSASLFVAPLLAVVPKQSLFADVLVHKPVPVDTEKLAAAELVIAPEQKESFSQDIINLHNKGKLIESNIISLLESKIPVVSVSGSTSIATSLMISAVTTASSIKKRMLDKIMAVIMKGESNLTAENVTRLANLYLRYRPHHPSGCNIYAHLDKEMIIELLKERKNVLVQEINDKVRREFPLVYIMDGMCHIMYLSLTLLPVRLRDPKAGCEISKAEDIFWRVIFGGVSIGFGLGATYDLGKVLTYRHEIRSREQEMNYIDEVIEKIESLDIA